MFVAGNDRYMGDMQFFADGWAWADVIPLEETNEDLSDTTFWTTTKFIDNTAANYDIAVESDDSAVLLAGGA